MTTTCGSFRLSENFVDKYRKIKPPFGFNGLGDLVFRRTYSRIKPDGTNEEWFETIERVINGTYNMQKKWVEQHSLGWNAWQAQKSAQEMYERMFYMKFLPPGRGLWAMGSAIVEDKCLFAALNNCGFTSTKNIKDDPSGPFTFLMDASMLGVGVGFDTLGAGTIHIKGPNENRKQEIFVIPDSREGWVESLRLLLESYFHGTASIEFDYSLIRKEGEPIKGFGGISSGSAPLIDLHKRLSKILDKEIGQPISVRTIVDIMNLIGRCVVSGNIRRSATIVFGDPYDEEYIELKNYKKNSYREEFGWASNNSIFAELGMDYSDAAQRTNINGEPGYVWLENIKAYSRMNNGPDNKDHRAEGTNPCFSGDTLIAVADGRHAVSIKQLAEEGVDVPVYSFDNSNLVIKFGRHPRLTAKSQQLLKLTLDDDSSVRVTGYHEFMKLNSEMVRADELKENDVLMYEHKIKKIELDTIEDVYCLTVDDTHKVCVIIPTSRQSRTNLVVTGNCCEQSLCDKELCCLVETFPARNDSLEDYLRTLKFAYLYAKTVTLGKTHWPETNRVLLRNRRIGCSMSGVAQFIAKNGIHQLKEWCQKGYDEIQSWDQVYSDWLAIPRSIKTTSCKPSGSVSLLAGATPGIHHPESRFYIRRMRLSKYSELVEPLRKSNYIVEPASEDPENTVVVEIPVDVGEGIRTVKELSMWEQATLAAFMQKYWADNQVSCTITFDPEKEGHQIKHLLDYFQYQLKGISFLPRKEKGAYKQMPYETIDEETYKTMSKKLKPIKFEKIKNEVIDVEKFCSNDSCELKVDKK